MWQQTTTTTTTTPNRRYTYTPTTTAATEPAASAAATEADSFEVCLVASRESFALVGWLRGTVVERRSLAGELSLSCAQPVADEWPLMWVNRLL